MQLLQRIMHTHWSGGMGGGGWRLVVEHTIYIHTHIYNEFYVSTATTELLDSRKLPLGPLLLSG